jgi:hypothetical protein
MDPAFRPVGSGSGDGSGSGSGYGDGYDTITLNRRNARKAKNV